ncbi:MAG: NAD kinase [Bacteroidales bacterium]|nr:NAD kinase [Bacteroidales bacterium]
MNIAIFGKSLQDENLDLIQSLFDKLQSLNHFLLVYEPFYQKIKDKISFAGEPKTFREHTEIRSNADYLFSIGGDGTLLDTITLVRDSGIPIMGINLGRMGFLSSVSRDRIESAIEQVMKKNYTIDRRTLLRLDTPNKLFGNLNYALNELSVYRKEPLSMIKIQAYVDGELLNSYWADGLIIATPTGSTAYSLSNGGPIILPHCRNFVITPIATHNLTVRPVVIPDGSEIRIKVVGRIKDYFVSLDSRSMPVESSAELKIVREDFFVNLIQLKDEHYFTTIREKLLWGLDIRN